MKSIFRQSTIVMAGIAFMSAVGLSGSAMAQMGGGLYAYPDAGQSKEQMEKDQFECHNWAAEQTRFDPNRAVDPRTKNYSYAQSSGAGDGSMIRGAAGGAAIGAIAGDAGKGAAIGAVFGGLRRASRRREEQNYNQQAQAQAQAQQQNDIAIFDQAINSFQRAYGSCMTSRKYRVQ